MKSFKSFFALTLAIVGALSAFFMPLTATATPSKADAQAIVDQAAAFVKANGKDKLVSEVNTQNGKFHKGDLYVFVYDLTGTLIADPVNPALLGQNNVEKPDADGKLFRKEIVQVANSKGEGWVDYRFKNPTTGNVAPKTTYFRKEGNVIIAAGIYQ